GAGRLREDDAGQGAIPHGPGHNEWGRPKTRLRQGFNNLTPRRGDRPMKTRRHVVTKFSQAAWIRSSALIAVALLSGARSLASAPAPAAAAPAIKNIVLVHGAFADGSSWAKVVPLLQEKGFHVTAVQNPLTSLADDVAATQRALAQQDGPVILVGHSWGGVVITEAGTDPKVAGLVYVAAFGPDQGEVVGDLGKAYPPPPALAAPIVDKQGFLTLPTDAVVKHFASDLPEKEALVVAATQGPIAGS